MSPVSRGETPLTTVTVYFGLGASLGDRAQNLRDAVDRLKAYDIRISAVSPVYESPHLGLDLEDSNCYPPHMNAVVAAETGLLPDALLDAVQAVELAGGRTRPVRWGPRTIDIDILAYGTLQIATERLVLPHPGIAQRTFVARPLLDVAPDFQLQDGRPLRDLMDHGPLNSQRIQKIGAMDQA